MATAGSHVSRGELDVGQTLQASRSDGNTGWLESDVVYNDPGQTQNCFGEYPSYDQYGDMSRQYYAPPAANPPATSVDTTRGYPNGSYGSVDRGSGGYRREVAARGVDDRNPQRRSQPIDLNTASCQQSDGVAGEYRTNLDAPYSTKDRQGQHSDAQSYAMSEYLRSNQDYAPSYYISYGGHRRQQH